MKIWYDVSMKIPKTTRRKALVIVDVQPGFINDNNQHIVESIKHLLDNVEYDLYACAVFYADDESLWNKQQNWKMPKGSDTKVLPEIADKLEGKDPIIINKSSRSAFKGDVDLASMLADNNIEEVHVVGTATHDCVLATAFEAFDMNFPVYVIEECCEAMNHPNRHELGVELLRYQNMTNNSCLADTEDI